MPFNLFDLIIALVFSYFSVTGLIRGFCKEIFGIIGFIAGIWLAYTYHPLVSEHLVFLEKEAWRTIAAYVSIFLSVNILARVCASLSQSILTLAMLPWADKLAGLILGFIKAILLSSIAVIIIQKFGQPSFLQDSYLLPHLTNFVENMRNFIPQDFFTINS